VCGVADENEAALAPARKRLEVVNVVPENRLLVGRLGVRGRSLRFGSLLSIRAFPVVPFGTIAVIEDEDLSQRGRARLGCMIGNVGDTIVIESERADATGRRGVIEDVVQGQPPRYQVRWEDGHTSILTPSAGSARIERRKRRGKARN
jgi:hypothetical protein